MKPYIRISVATIVILICAAGVEEVGAQGTNSVPISPPEEVESLTVPPENGGIPLEVLAAATAGIVEQGGELPERQMAQTGTSTPATRPALDQSRTPQQQPTENRAVGQRVRRVRSDRTSLQQPQENLTAESSRVEVSAPGSPANRTMGGGDNEAFAANQLVGSTNQVAAQADDGRFIRLNFRGAPLEIVLDYLSEAAGFIIRPEVDVKGRIDVWSAQPLTPDEALEVLNAALAKQGYTVVRDGRTLIVLTRDEAKRRYVPVVKGANPDSIPRTDEIVTQIIPVRFLNAAQLMRDLQPLIPSSTTVTANEGGNALIVTDTRANIRRLTEIIYALDTSVSSVATIRVFQLQYADAKSLANIIQSIFQQSTTGTGGQGDIRARFFARFFGGPGGGGQQAGEGESGVRAGAMRVAAVADERSNSLVVSAPEDLMQTIEELIKAVDVNVEDVTEIRVFKLKNADPTEMAELLMSLFPDQTTQQGQQRGMGRFFMGPPQFQQGDQTTPSQRALLQTRVIAVPDPRTGALVVTAPRNLMNQIEKMIAELDADAGRKQKVFVFDVENVDPIQVQSVLQSLFPAPTTTGARASSQTTSQLSRRANQAVSGSGTTTRSTTGFGTGLGTGTGIGRTTTR